MGKTIVVETACAGGTRRFLRNGINAVEETVEVGLSSAPTGTAVRLIRELDDLPGRATPPVRAEWRHSPGLSALFD